MTIVLKGTLYTLPHWYLEEISYTERPSQARAALRSAFSPVRSQFLKTLVQNDRATLRQAGFSSSDIAVAAAGVAGYQVHHILPLDDGGTNDFSNLVLIKTDPDHKLLTNYQKNITTGLQAGDTRSLKWPVPDEPTAIWPDMPGGGAIAASTVATT